MRNTNTIQIIGIGNFKIYPVTEEDKEYNKINSNGEVLKKVVVVAGTPTKYSYVDSNNKHYENKDIYTDFNGLKLQAIKKTENVKKFEIVDKTEIYNLTEYSVSLLNVNETTMGIFENQVGNNAIKFTFKKSSVGFNFCKSYILKMNNQLVLISGKGNLQNAMNKFKEVQNSKEQNEVIFTKLEVKAEDLEIEL